MSILCLYLSPQEITKQLVLNIIFVYSKTAQQPDLAGDKTMLQC